MKKILAIIAVIVLVGIYILTLFMAIFDSSHTMSMFKGCIALTIFVPVVAYCYMAIHKYLVSRSNPQDTPKKSDADSSTES